MYYIYHIPGVKIGCTRTLKLRMREQGFTDWAVLEQHSDIYEASSREIELQKEYGYGRDTPMPYWKTVLIAQNEETNFKKSNTTKGRPNDWQRVLTFEIAEEIRGKYLPKKYSMYKLSVEYNVSVATINRIVHNLMYQS